MKYRQDAKLNSNKKTATGAKGLSVQQIVFDKEITQEWKVDTNEPTEILPYGMKKIYLNRLCEFWHQLKFFYHQNNHQLHQPQTNSKTVSLQFVEIQSHSSVQIVHSAQVIENCKRISKVIWKIMRHRLIKGFNSIKQRAGMEQDQSLELQDDKLRSYMIFLKLQQNSRIDLAIETCDSVVDKNIRRKLLEAFLGMKQHFKRSIKRQTYQDRIKLECFSEIIMRNIKKLNIDLFIDSFTEIVELAQSVKREEEYEQQERRRKMSLEKNDHYKSISNRKVVINDEDESESVQRRDTVLKNQQKGHQEMNGKELRQNENHISTVKREHLLQKQVLTNSNITSQYHSNIKSTHQKITHSHYYYQDEEKPYQDQRHFQHNQHYHNQHKTDNMNSLPTKRQHRSNNYAHNNPNHPQHNQYLITGVQNNINSQTLFPQKTVRTPSRSEFNKNHHSHQSQSLSQQSKHSFPREDLHIPVTQTIDQHYHQVHIPITQTIDQHYHQDHYQQLLEQQSSHHHHEESNSNIHQQICVIRNFSTTPTRKPDRYQKIPILSNNIEFKQFFLNSKQKPHHKLTSHSSSFYQRKICSQCHFCSKLAKIKLMLQQISKQRHDTQTHQTIIENVTINNQIITETLIAKEKQLQNKELNHQQSKYQSLGYKNDRQTKKEYTSMQLDIDKINQNSNSRTQLQKIQTPNSNLKNQNETQFVEEKYIRNHSPNSPLMTPIAQSLHTPLSQVSAFTEGTKKRGLSERKIFKRKPFNGK